MRVYRRCWNELPSEETLVYLDKVEPWVVNGEVTDKGVKLVFRESTPQSIFDLLDEIKDKLDFNIL